MSASAEAEAVKRGETDEVTGSLNFIVRQDEKPYFHSALLTGGKPKFFFDVEAKTVPIRDMRALSDTSVDREGFELLLRPTDVSDLNDDDAIAGDYYRELEQILRERFEAKRVVIFDSTRRSDRSGGASNPDGARRPASHIHVDYTVDSGPTRVRQVLGDEEADRLLQSGARVRQINVWRPIVSPVQRSPLALADASSVAPEDLIATDQIFPERVGEIYHLAYSPDHRWFYAPHMARDEILLIKSWDSNEDGLARFTPHTAFELPNTPASAPSRESIETRTLVIG